MISGPRRRPKFDRHLAYLLVLQAGALNAIGFMALGLYTSHMSGMVADIANHVMRAEVGLLLTGLLAVGSFTAGTMACTIIFTWARRRRLASRYANVLVFEATLILIVGILASDLDHLSQELTIVPPLCFAMGLQNALITKIRDFPVRTTHVTGMITDLGVEVGTWVYGRFPRSGGPPVRMDREKATVLALLVMLFMAGGGIGIAGFWLFDFRALIIGALLILLLSLPPSIRDLSRVGPRSRRRAQDQTV
ncbi:YoaK family protein [Rothia uropygialis]|uniref:YoaK family protein n=1 Tax=Kocuria sp. 36 TaxID=1415402 RepID=UPI001EE8CDB3|nr:YoaK family protein [Kocuria sp. 36]